MALKGNILSESIRACFEMGGSQFKQIFLIILLALSSPNWGVNRPNHMSVQKSFLRRERLLQMMLAMLGLLVMRCGACSGREGEMLTLALLLFSAIENKHAGQVRFCVRACKMRTHFECVFGSGEVCIQNAYKRHVYVFWALVWLPSNHIVKHCVL